MTIIKSLLVCTKSCAIVLFFITFSLTHTYSQQLAFPSAMGAGAYTEGGRGGEVVHVTNLNDSGTGSLRWALTDNSLLDLDRTIVFDVSGVIVLNDDIDIFGNGGITIAGQTAPEGNITVTGGKMKFYNDNLIVRYIKGRSTTNTEGVIQSRNSNNIIFDHISASNVESGEVSIGMTHNPDGERTNNKTIQNCLVAYAGLGCIIGDTSPDRDDSNDTHSLIKNAYVFTGHRIPAKIGGAVRIDILNNLSHGHITRLITIDDWSFTMNHLGNYYSSGRGINRLNMAYYGQRNGKIYESDNYYDPAFGSIEPWRDFTQPRIDPLPASSFVQSEFPYNNPETLNILSSTDLKTQMLPFVGCYKYIDNNGQVVENRDTIDTMAINDATNEVQRNSNEVQDIRENFNVNDIPTVNNTRPTNFYQSNPHIPEAWLVSQGITGDANIHNQIQPSGYTLLEEYVNQVDTVGNVEATGLNITPDVATLNVSETINLDVQFIPVNTTDQTGVWTSENEFIATVDTNGTVTGVSEGIVEIRFVSNDGGFTDISLITVTPLPLIADAGEDQTICEGESIQLTANDAPSYLWSTGETTQSITVSPITTTIYTLTVSNGNEEDTDDVTVFVDVLPSLTVTSDVTIIEGNSVELQAQGANEYLWNTGETTSTITVSPNVTTTYTITGSNGACEVQAQVTVTVEEIFEANAGDDQTICEGESIQLAANDAPSYLWSTGETTQSITVNPDITTTYTVTISNGNEEDSDQVTVFVDNLPDLTISEDVTIIEGNSTVLIAEGANEYLWNTGETTSSITVSPNATATYNVTGTNGACEVQAQVTVTVEQVFQANAGDDERICEGSGEEVTLNAGTGDTYLWSTGETSQSITVSPISTTTYSVTISSGIQEDTDDVTVFVDPNPNVVIVNGDSVDILNGDFITLSATGANTYEWNNGATQPNIAVSPSITSTFEVRGYINDCYDEKQVTVNVFEPVQAYAGGDISICLNEVATLTATGGDEFLWSTGESTQSIQVSPFITTDYTVTVFNALDFDEATVRVTVLGQCNESTEGQNDLSDDVSFNIYPNPAYSYVNVRLNGGSEVSDVLIYDFTGKIVQQNRIENQNQLQEINSRIELRALSNGIYFIKLVDNNGNELTKKLIVRGNTQ